MEKMGYGTCFSLTVLLFFTMYRYIFCCLISLTVDSFGLAVNPDVEFFGAAHAVPASAASA
jgi:hypothetical protein